MCGVPCMVNVQDTYNKAGVESPLVPTPAMGNHVSAAAKSAIRAAGSAPVPGVKVGGELLVAIISLCEAVAQKRHYPFPSAIKP